MKTGLFGGTFNPLHNGHIKTIKYVTEKFVLDKVFFIPCATPPHKGRENLAPAKERFDMVRLGLDNAFAGDRYCASDIELKRSGPSFTIDTIKEFKKRAGPGDKFFLILGSDAFFDIETWKNFQGIFHEICVIIMLREQLTRRSILIDKISCHIEKKISDNYTFDNGGEAFIHGRKKSIFIAQVPEINISSTMIRKRIKQGSSINNLTPAPVAEHIHDKGLYL